MTALVDTATGESVETCSPDRARDLTDKIKTSLGVAWELVKDAYRERAWAALGYRSWDAYVAEEFGSHTLRLPREERQEVVVSLRQAGMSIRAIATATGADRNTVRGDLRAREVGEVHPPGSEPAPAVTAETHRETTTTTRTTVTGTDGKTYPAAPKAPPAEPKRRALPDQFFDAAYDLTKKVEAVHRLTQDDRWPANREKVAAKHRNDLLEAHDLLQQVIDHLPEG